MQESLGGNSKTAVVATVTPSACSAGETYCTLAFAAGAKKMKCRAVVNEDEMERDSVNEEMIRASGRRMPFCGQSWTRVAWRQRWLAVCRAVWRCPDIIRRR